MSKRSELLYLGHMLDAARKAHAKATSISRADLDTNEDLQMIITHLIQIIGEAARRTPASVRESHPEIQWKEIIGMRHKVVHDYFEIDLDILWRTATERLPVLIASLEKITPPEPPSV